MLCCAAQIFIDVCTTIQNHYYYYYYFTIILYEFSPGTEIGAPFLYIRHHTIGRVQVQYCSGTFLNYAVNVVQLALNYYTSHHHSKFNIIIYNNSSM